MIKWLKQLFAPRYEWMRDDYPWSYDDEVRKAYQQQHGVPRQQREGSRVASED